MTTGRLQKILSSSLLSMQEEELIEKDHHLSPRLLELKRSMARFVPTPLEVSTVVLSPGDQQALVKLIEAADVMNEIFFNQLWDDNQTTFAELKQDKSEMGRALAHYYWLNKSPWSVVDQGKSFISDIAAAKLPGAHFYPRDMSKQEFESWVATLEEKDQAQALGYFTILRRMLNEDTHNQLSIVPYSEVYKPWLDRAAALLREAASLTDNSSLNTYLRMRADAFASNDYYASDIAWMELDAPLDITIGPYETYQDELFGYKAAYEAFINLRDDVETAKVACFSQYLQEIEDNLPIDPQYRNPKIGSQAPIRVVNEIFAAGDAARGVPFAAFNLPNDKRILSQTGAKRVLLKNIQEEKFKHILFPLAEMILAESELKDVIFDAYFTHTLAHELSHGLGPQSITVKGRQTTVRAELKDKYSAIEEAKADVMGLFLLQYLLDKQVEQKIPQGTVLLTERQLYLTYFADMFRTMRFGVEQSHGRGMLMQFNYLHDKGAITLDENGKYSIVLEKVKPALYELTHDLLIIEATGDYHEATKLLASKATISPDLQSVLDKMKNIPTDIEPIFVTAKQLVAKVVASGAEFEKPTVLKSMGIS